MRHSSQVKLRHGKNCAKCGGSESSLIGSLHLGQRKGELLAFSMLGGPILLEQHHRISENGYYDGRYSKRCKLNDAVPIHRHYYAGCGSLFTLSAIIAVSCIAP